MTFLLSTWQSIFFIGIPALVSHYLLGNATLGAIFGLSVQVGLSASLIGNDVIQLKKDASIGEE